MTHKHKCIDCGRELTDPISIQWGIGPECRKNRLRSSLNVGGDTPIPDPATLPDDVLELYGIYRPPNPLVDITKDQVMDTKLWYTKNPERIPHQLHRFFCHVRVIVRNCQVSAIVGATDHKGSICNQFGVISTLICRETGIPQIGNYFEHWGPWSYKYARREEAREISWSRVTFSYDANKHNLIAPGYGYYYAPDWHQITREGVEEIIGQKIDPFIYETEQIEQTEWS